MTNESREHPASGGGGTLSCAEVEDLAAELALNVLPGDQRALALAHLNGCSECRRIVDDLSQAADALTFAVPRVTPPPGFVDRILREVRPSARRRRRSLVAAIGTAVVAAAVVVMATLPGGGGGGLPSSLSQAALSSKSVRVARFTATGSEHLSGVVLIHSSPSWLFMTMSDDDPGGHYVCEVEYTTGQTLRVGSFAVRDGAGAWGQTLPQPADAIRAVRVLSPDGSVVASATFG